MSLPKQQPYLMRWMKGFLPFAWGHGGYTFELTLDLSLAKGGGQVGWQSSG